MMNEDKELKEYSERYVKNLEVYNELLQILEMLTINIMKVRKEIQVLEEELIKKGVTIKKVE